MRILHTADWHLGRTLHGMRLIDDQSHVLDQVVRIAKGEQVDVVIISGDVYDRAVHRTRRASRRRFLTGN